MKENKKSLFINFIYNSIYSSIGVVFPLITVPYLSRILLADGLGKVNYAYNIVAWFLLFAQLGIPRYGVREIAKVKKNQNNLVKTFNELFTINFLSTILCIAVFVLMIFRVGYFRSKALLFMVTGIQLVLNVLNVDWFYQGMEEYGYITKRSVFIKILSLILMFLFVRNHEDYIIYAIIQSLAVAGNNLFNFIHLRNFISFDFDNLVLKKHISPILILLSTQLAVSIYTLLDTTMLGIWCSYEVIGYYSNSQKIIKILATFTAALGGVMLPRLVKYYADEDYDKVKKLSEKALKIIVTMCLPMSIGLMLIASNIVSILFGTDFFPCIQTLRIFAPFILFTTIGNLYGTQLLMVFGEEKRLLRTVMIGAGINFCMNAILIPRYQQDGAAVASVVTEFIVMLMQIKIVYKHMKLKLSFKYVYTTVFLTILMSVSVLLVRSVCSSQWLFTFLSISMSCAVFFGVGLLIKHETVIYIYMTVKKKIME